jgi:hypothetical protein
VLELRDPRNGIAIPPSPPLRDEHQVSVGDKDTHDLTSRLLSPEPVEGLGDEDSSNGSIAKWNVLGDADASIDRREPSAKRIQHWLRRFDRYDVAYHRDEGSRQLSGSGTQVEHRVFSAEAQCAHHRVNARTGERRSASVVGVGVDEPFTRTQVRGHETRGTK